MTFLIAAAGTGGHVFPGQAVGEGLLSFGIDRDEIVFVGGNRLEATVYPEAGFRFLGLELAGLQRSLTLENLRIPRVVRRAKTSIATEIQRSGVRTVLGMGGYVTVPAGLAARGARIPLFCAEQNAEAGLANRFVSRWAREVFVSFRETRGLAAGNWVGNPVREMFWEFDRAALREEARKRYDLTDGRPVLGVFGGSLGAKTINEAVAAMITGWSGEDVGVVHLTGRSHLRDLSGYTTPDNAVWRRVGFEERMDLFFAVCDLVISRAGGAVAEITATGTPAVLVPGRFGSGGHQEGNARALDRAGAAVVLDDNDLVHLPETVSQLIADPTRRERMAEAAREIAKPDAARTIAAAMIEAAS